MIGCRIDSPAPRRLGLTLMELVVVLTILVALGGIVAALLPDFLTKAHDAVTVTNIAEVDKAIMGFLSTNLQYPDYFDSITNGTNMYSRAVFNPTGSYSSQYGNQATYNGQNVFSVTSLTASQSQSLMAGGIQHLMTMQDPPSNDGATFGCYLSAPFNPTTGAANSGSFQTVSSTSTPKVIMVNDPSYMQNVMHVPPPSDGNGGIQLYNTDYIYVVFGLGQYCSIVGNRAYGMFECPVSFGEHQYEQPQNSYARMLCAFRVYSDGDRCEFVGSAHPDPTGFGTAAMHTEEFYQTN